MIRAKKINFTFMGQPVYNVSIEKSMRAIDRVYMPSLNKINQYDCIFLGTGIPELATMNFSMVDGRSTNLIIDDMRRNYGGNFISLSPSGVCQNCGSFFSAGTLKCHNCHGYVKDEIASVKQSRFNLLNVDYGNLLPRDEMNFLEIEISFDDDYLDLLSSLIVNKPTVELTGLPNSFKLHEDYILCDCCLSIVKAGSICPNCGGARLPFSEVVKIDRECIFCGQKTYDGVMCKSCGASLSGIAYRELLL